MPLTLRRRLRDRRGQALVEYALMLPILVGLLVAMIEFAQCWSTYQTMTHAAREGARTAVIPGSTEQQVSDRIYEVLEQGGLAREKTELVLGIRDGTGTMDTIQVAYNFPFPLLAPVVSWLSEGTQSIPGTVRLLSTFTMRNE